MEYGDFPANARQHRSTGARADDGEHRRLSVKRERGREPDT